MSEEDAEEDEDEEDDEEEGQGVQQRRRGLGAGKGSSQEQPAPFRLPWFGNLIGFCLVPEGGAVTGGCMRRREVFAVVQARAWAWPGGCLLLVAGRGSTGLPCQRMRQF